MATSPGHLCCEVDVIIANTTCFDAPLNAADEQTNAGRRFEAARSENGNGTITTSPGLKAGIRKVVGSGIPFRRERGLEGLQLLVG